MTRLPSLPALAAVLACLLAAACSASPSASSSFPPLSRAEVDRLSLETKLQLLEERGVRCEDCSEQDASEEVFAWQQLPVLKSSSSLSPGAAPRHQRSIHDEANVQEVLNQMRDSGFGMPSSLKPADLKGARGSSASFQPPKKKSSSKKRSRK